MTQTVRNVLMLGGTGFAGRHMVHLLEPDHRVFAFGRETDIRDIDAICRVVAKIKPDWVVNFASISTVREAFADPATTYDIAFLGTLNLLTVLKEHDFDGRILNISSSEVYGHPSADGLPLTESSPLRPVSPYSVAKLAAEHLCYQWWRSEGIQIMTARPFTHIGPEILYSSYWYRSGTNQTMRDHLKGIADEAKKLCKNQNRVVAEYALRDTNKPIGVAEYQLVEVLPAELLNSLPSIEQIERELDKGDQP